MTIWRKSTHSGSIHETECVEVAGLAGRAGRTIGVRDSKNPYGPVLTVSRRDFRVLLDHLKADGRIGTITGDPRS